jgi:poly(A) polymerase
MIQLPDIDWRKAEGLKAILAALTVDGQAPLVVGGAVRDSLLDLPVSDVDLATPLLPSDVVDRLAQANIKAIPTGIDHGTITAVADGKNYEITTFRRDVATDGRRATVAFSTDWREDAERRDFTINALYANVESGEIFDHVGGLDDLKSRHIRFIGDAGARIAEDHLRILRYFRFLARFGDQSVDETALRACVTAANSLKSLSRERIASELTRMLALPDPSFAVGLMADYDIFDTFLPELTADAANKIGRLVKREGEFGQAPSMPARLLVLLPGDTKVVQDVGRRLKLSNRLIKDLIARIVSDEVNEQKIRAIGYAAGVSAARDIAMLYANDTAVPACLSRLENWTPPQFKLKGGDLISMGLAAGPIVATRLQQIEQQWVQEGFPDETRLAEIARQLVSREVT